MDENRTTKKVFNAHPIGTRRKIRPNIRRIDGLEKDPLILRTKNWRISAGRRVTGRKGFLRSSRPTLSCRVTEEGRKLNSVAQQLMSSKAYCAHLSIRDLGCWLRCLSKCPDQVLILKHNPRV
ncbi:hypothetical protein TNCV_89301 [Trichonephila clavipes]|nr:hypothetical protein TNCV_89301 [Trichonephila clavipes]